MDVNEHACECKCCDVYVGRIAQARLLLIYCVHISSTNKKPTSLSDILDAMRPIFFAQLAETDPKEDTFAL